MKYLMTFFLFAAASSAMAEEYTVSAGRVNFRSTAEFNNGDSNVLQVVEEGQKMVLIKDNGTNIEAALVPSGQHGFIWKKYVELQNTHDLTAPPDASGITFPEGKLRIPICGCTDCHRTSPFGLRTRPRRGASRNHKGCDIGAPTGTAVYAVEAGVVKLSGSISGYGNTIDIEHAKVLKDKNGSTVSADGFTSRYGHLQKRLVAKGDHVTKGQKIGLVNTTGVSTGPHLHIEIAVKGTAVDPERFMTVSDANKSCQSLGSDSTPVKQ